MMKLNAFLLTEFAAITTEGKVVIAGTFDTMSATPKPGVTPPRGAIIPLMPCYLVAITECSVSDGLVHPMRFRVVDGSGKQVGEMTPFNIQYEMNRQGA